MSTQGDFDKDDEEYSFIQEKIVPKTKNTKKKLVRYTCFTLVLGIVFGIVSSLVFNVSNHVISNWNQENEKSEPIQLSNHEEEHTQREEEVTENPRQKQVGKASTGEKLSDPDISSAFGMRSYQKVFNLVKDMTEEVKHCMVTVIGVTNITSWFEMENYKSSYGLILKMRDDYIYILCDYSQVKDVNKIKVKFYNGEMIRAEFLDCDEESQLAILKLKTGSVTQRTMAKIEQADLGDSYQLTSGMPIVGLGAPDGTMYSMGIGYVTAPCIDKYIVDGKLTYYHTSIPENPYGQGFFVNMEGKVIGIITHKYKEKSDENIMSFLGISKLMPRIEALVNQKGMPYLGVKVCDITNEDGKKVNVDYGIYVTDVIAKSPAFKEGIKTGDIITEIDGTGISSVSALTSTLKEKEPGDDISFAVKRRSSGEYSNTSFEDKRITVTLE